MEILIGLVLLAVFVGVPLFGLVMMIAISKTSRDRGKAEGNAEQILDEVFDGRRTVVYDSRPSTSLRSAVVVEGAIARGYRLAHDSEGELVFEKA